MNDDVKVSDWTWHTAMLSMDPLACWSGELGPRPSAFSDYPRILVQSVVDFLSLDLTCDHSVNICMCSTAAAVAELRLNLAGQETCDECGGEGHVWDQRAYDAAKAQREEMARKAKEGLIDWPDEHWWEGPYSDVYNPCERCNQKGVTDQ